MIPLELIGGVYSQTVVFSGRFSSSLTRIPIVLLKGLMGLASEIDQINDRLLYFD